MAAFKCSTRKACIPELVETKGLPDEPMMCLPASCWQPSTRRGQPELCEAVPAHIFAAVLPPPLAGASAPRMGSSRQRQPGPEWVMSGPLFPKVHPQYLSGVGVVGRALPGTCCACCSCSCHIYRCWHSPCLSSLATLDADPMAKGLPGYVKEEFSTPICNAASSPMVLCAWAVTPVRKRCCSPSVAGAATYCLW
jgi:hypothetical protein